MSYCRNCKHELDAHSAAEGENRPPQKGDVSVCAYCGTPSLFDEELNLIPLTGEELKDIRENDPDCYRVMQNLLTIITRRINMQ